MEIRNLSFGGGDEGDRTPDLGIANAALSHLSYIPTKSWLVHIKLHFDGQFKKERKIPVLLGNLCRSAKRKGCE
jgi:hypothetical protein